MPDPLAGQPTDDASAEAPVVPNADIEKITAQFRAELDARVAGLQRVIAAKDELITGFRSELDQFKTAGLSEEEREQLEIEKVRQENARLQAQLDLRDLAKDYGDEMPYFERLIAADSAEDQLKVMRDYRASLAAAVAQAPAPEAAPLDPPEVDPNRPMRSFDAGQLMPDGSRMTDALAEQILSGIPGPQAAITQRRIVPTR